MTGPPPWRLIAVLLVIGVLAALVLIGRPTRVEWYGVQDEDTIIVGVTGGGSGTWTWVREVAVSEDAVSLVVRTVSLPVPLAGVGYPLQLTVELGEPLGDRAVVDGPTGSEVPRTRCPDRPLAPDCRISD